MHASISMSGEALGSRFFSFPVVVVPMGREKFKTHNSFLSRVDKPRLSFNPSKRLMIV
jgi:hypothetical protein